MFQIYVLALSTCVGLFMQYICWFYFVQYGLLAEALIVDVFCAFCSSEFLELEAVPTASHLEGPLERGPIASSTLPEMNQEEPLERFFVWRLYPILFAS